MKDVEKIKKLKQGLNIENIKKFILKYKGYIICILIIILSIISIIMQDLDKKNSVIIDSEKVKSNNNKIVVYISGQVKNPGIYELDKEARIYNLIDACGGIEIDADIDKINLAQKLNDADKIIIPKKVENVVNIDEESEINGYDEDSVGKININEASLEELKTLSGIGDATAKKIIEYRKNNYFNEIEDIMNVPGIGESKFNNIKDDICTK